MFDRHVIVNSQSVNRSLVFLKSIDQKPPLWYSRIAKDELQIVYSVFDNFTIVLVVSIVLGPIVLATEFIDDDLCANTWSGVSIFILVCH